MFHRLNSLYLIFLLLNYHLSFLVSAPVLVCEIIIIIIIIIYSAYTERRGSCKMASFSDVKLKAP